MLKIQFFGAVGTVTGSCYFLSDESGKGILVDFGMFQGSGETPELNATPLPIDAKNILGVVLTHAHLDHCGRLPMLIGMGYFGKVYMTVATKSLIELTLIDAAHVAEKNFTKDLLYTEQDVFQLLRKIQTVDYDAEIQLSSYAITFRDAGHILGSSIVEVVHKEEQKKIIFSGDLGNTPEELVRPTADILDADIVIMESTYGDKIHPKEDTNGIIQNEINTIEKSGGVLLIPAFSLDRTQELLHKLNHLKKDGKILEDTPVFLDSPMGIHATFIYERFPELYNEELSQHAERESPFDFSGLSLVEHGKESYNIKEIAGSKVIIAGNGMMGGGRIMRHAALYLSDVTTRLLIVGYQAEGTIGRKIQDGARRVMIDNTSIAVNATVTSIEGMTAHADQPKLLNWIRQIKGVKKVFITHGEDAGREALAGKIQEIGINDVVLPKIDEVFEI